MNILRTLRDALIGDDPAPEYSRLDFSDGLGRTLAPLVVNDPDQVEARKILTTLIPALWDAIPDTADGYEQARRIASVAVHHDLNFIQFDTAMEACAAIYDVEHGGCLNHMYGDANTVERRDYWLDYERMNLTCAINDLTGSIPVRVKI